MKELSNNDIAKLIRILSYFYEIENAKTIRHLEMRRQTNQMIQKLEKKLNPNNNQ